jgi:hypothetical protein
MHGDGMLGLGGRRLEPGEDSAAGKQDSRHQSPHEVILDRWRLLMIRSRLTCQTGFARNLWLRGAKCGQAGWIWTGAQCNTPARVMLLPQLGNTKRGERLVRAS